MKRTILLKTMLLLCALIAGSTSSWADEVTLKYSGTTTANMKADGSNEAASVGLDASEWSVVASKGAASNAPGLNKAGDIRLYWHADGGNTITVSSLTNATISSIAITFTGDAYNNVSVTVDGNAVTGTDGVYDINSTSFVLGNANTASAQVRISQIVITFDGGGVTDNRIATTITQDNIVLDVADVATLTRLAPVVKDKDGNVIEYQYDVFPTDVSFDIVSDETPIISSFSNNTGEIELFSVAGTATLKAYYNHWNTSDVYKPSECTFTITVVSPLENIAALTANTEAGTYKVKLTDAVVTYVNGNYAYIQDASGAVVMYKEGHGLTAGDALNGTATVAYQLQKNNPQITSLEGVTPTEGEAPDPTIIAADEWSFTFTDVLSQYFQVTGATITKSNDKYYVALGEDNVQLYKQGSSISSLNLSKKYTITGFPTLYNSTKELQIFADPEEEVSTDPTINADDVIIEADATSGGIAYTIDNPTGATLSATLTDGDWISNINVTAEKVTFTATVNTGAQRTATITLSYTGAEDKVVTITQKACVVASLPFTFDGGKADIDNTPGLTQDGLGSDYSSSPKLKFDGTGDELVLRINEKPGALTFDIKGNSFSGGTFKVQTSADGTYYEDLATYTELGAKQTELFNLLPNVRYIKWVYTEKVTGNVALGNINLKTKYAVKIGDAGYTTFWSMRAHDFTGFTAYVVSDINANCVTLTEVTSAPAGTGVILKADEGIYELEETDSPAAVGTNLLQTSRGYNVAGESAENDYYVLAKKTDVGFYKLKDGVTIPNGKCFLSISKSTGAPDFLGFGDDATGINTLNVEQGMLNGEFYNLAGQRVAQPTKGLYIVNGRKVVIK